MRRSLLVLSAAALFVVAATASSSANTMAAAAVVDEPAVAVPESAPVAAVSSPAPALEAEHPAAAPLVAAAAAIAKTAPAEPRLVKATPRAATLVSSSRDACVMSLPVDGDPASFLATAKKVLASKGGSVSGGTTAGRFSVPAPLGTIDGSYALADGAAQLTIAPASLGFVQSCSAVYTGLSSALRR